MSGLRAMASALVSRARFGRTGTTYDGMRDVDAALGYKQDLDVADYRRRFDRNEIAAAVVEAYPIATWRGGGELVEDEDPETVTPFEEQFAALAERLQVWPRFQRADVLAGLGEFAIIVIGSRRSADLAAELPKMKGPDDVIYLSVYSKQDAEIGALETDGTSERFGQPKTYLVDTSRTASRLTSQRGTSGPRREIHWSRVIPIADGLLEDDVNGTPRLQRIWNRLDDLDKVVGGGAESFWQRAQQGMQLDIDKEIKLSEDGKKALQAEVDEYMHGLRRVMRTQGMRIEMLGSDVANFNPQADTILTLIAGGARIPKRILTGSELGELASSQDETNFAQRVSDRQTNWAHPYCVKALVDRLVKYGALPAPETFVTVWPDDEGLDEVEKAEITAKYATANNQNVQAGGRPIVSENEIRDSILGFEPLEDDDPNTDPTAVDDPAVDPAAAADPAAAGGDVPADEAAPPIAATTAARRLRIRVAKLALRAARARALGDRPPRALAKKNRRPGRAGTPTPSAPPLTARSSLRGAP